MGADILFVQPYKGEPVSVVEVSFEFCFALKIFAANFLETGTVPNYKTGRKFQKKMFNVVLKVKKNDCLPF